MALLSDVVVVPAWPARVGALDLMCALAGPARDLGARVIRVESPNGGDDSRMWRPPFVGEGGARESTYFFSCNRNKESVTADPKSKDGKAFLRRLVGHSDVLLIEHVRPGVLDRLDFSVVQLQQINSRLVILAIPGFRHERHRTGCAGSSASACWPQSSRSTHSRAPASRSGRKCRSGSADNRASIASIGLFRTADTPVQVLLGQHDQSVRAWLDEADVGAERAESTGDADRLVGRAP